MWNPNGIILVSAMRFMAPSEAVEMWSNDNRAWNHDGRREEGGERAGCLRRASRSLACPRGMLGPQGQGWSCPSHGHRLCGAAGKMAAERVYIRMGFILSGDRLEV